ncbi:biliverdin-producing heme oxygenase [Occultella glacieicola]|uniref:Biliverdin-producing heme oxygenase n=1 Tax=Occultella glacieicola TaxID=2518684 RepID=A0ABY2EDL2_9MICO|nr:biliverdin-producing heme oxygenase [Occultella glacieicola]TDE98977.1 biliverdin-producing heme oxygenase [Occultella glacieicola]
MTLSPTQAAADLDEPASLLLRSATRDAHERAESTGFVQNLMGGHLDVAAYAALAVQHRAIYAALESAGDRVRRTPTGAGLVFDELRRGDALATDLAFLIGAEHARRVTILPETRRYVDRLEGLGEDVVGYLAHAYTRYLGDLSGGQVIKRMMQRHYGLAEDGLAFYTFEQIEKIPPFKDRYRAAMDALPLTGSDRERLVAEARLAFDLNAEVFGALGRLHRPEPSVPSGLSAPSA